MKTTFYKFFIITAAFTTAIITAYAQEGSTTTLRLLPSQERIPQVDSQPRVPPEYVIPPAVSPPSYPVEEWEAPPPSPVVQNSPQFKAPLVSGLERGKWYVQIGAYSRSEYVENAVNRVGTTSPVVIHSVGTETNPMFRVMLGPFSQAESKTMMQRFKDKGYDAFLRNGN